MSAQYIYTMHKVSRFYPPDRDILKEVTLSFFPGAKIGVIGGNGAGKSSILKIMAGIDTEYTGEARLTPGFTVGMLEQEPHLDDSKDVIGNVMDGVGAVVAVAEHDVDDRTDGVVALHLENEVGEALGGELDQTVGSGNSGKMTGRLQEFRVDRAHLGCGYVAHGVPGVIVEG